MLIPVLLFQLMNATWLVQCAAGRVHCGWHGIRGGAAACPGGGSSSSPARWVVVVPPGVCRQDAPRVGGGPLDLLAHIAIIGGALVVAPAWI